MDTLALVTLIALVLAMSMVMITARLLREERRRSEARVAALTAAAGTAQPLRAVAPTDPFPLPRAVIDDYEIRPSSPSARSEAAPQASAAMFGATGDRASGGSWRLASVVAVGAFVVGLTGALIVWSNSRGSTTADAGAAAAASAPSGVSPLELVALRHRRDGERLAISGIIKNPTAGRAVRNVSAVVFLFDSSGSFLSSGRAPVDFTTLAPGEESPFVVVVSEPGAVARYRVSFRSDDHVMPHVDRREPGGPATGTAAPAVSRLRDRTAGSAAEHPMD